MTPESLEVSKMRPSKKKKTEIKNSQKKLSAKCTKDMRLEKNEMRNSLSFIIIIIFRPLL